ncbi:hypothetical protein Pmani_001904 [Petrolisthes manimaculis]|uniref:Uncharacterized protein n=1 Tax=Petrolisthes manimaculis TaxID=1843537 RepID=A0AAE1QJ11_9EUCA|nr:hypothetical protein Pmani_001904 [Petrolisthes manimaculis]
MVSYCRVFLKTDLVSKSVNVAVQDKLPVEGVSFLLGNDIAGNKVVPNPIVTSVPTRVNNTEALEKEIPELFPSCDVTRNMKKKAECDVVPSTTDDEDDDSGIGSLFQTDVVYNSPVLPQEVVSPVAGSHIDTESVLVDTVPVSRNMLSEAQRGVPELKPLYARAVDLNEFEKLSVCYYLEYFRQ